jgi:hypothetical protein
VSIGFFFSIVYFPSNQKVGYVGRGLDQVICNLSTNPLIIWWDLEKPYAVVPLWESYIPKACVLQFSSSELC